MMLRHRAPEVLSGAVLSNTLAVDVDRVVVLDHLLCTAVAMDGGHVRAMAIAPSRAAALRKLSHRVTCKPAPQPLVL